MKDNSLENEMTAKALHEWEQKHNPFYPEIMRYNRDHLIQFASEYATLKTSQLKEQLEEKDREIEKWKREAESLDGKLTDWINIESHANQSAAGWISEDDVEWVVNDNAELGVKIGTNFFWLYKGESLSYGDGQHDDGTQMMYRPVGKREFGECCHPVHLERLPDKYTEGEGWMPLPPSLQDNTKF